MAQWNLQCSEILKLSAAAAGGGPRGAVQESGAPPVAATGGGDEGVGWGMGGRGGLEGGRG